MADTETGNNPVQYAVNLLRVLGNAIKIFAFDGHRFRELNDALIVLLGNDAIRE